MLSRHSADLMDESNTLLCRSPKKQASQIMKTYECLSRAKQGCLRSGPGKSFLVISQLVHRFVKPEVSGDTHLYKYLISTLQGNQELLIVDLT